MTGITIRVLDGADRGRVFQNLTPPITIGREEGNTIQLNDERVSRYHVKIQEDHNRLVITDLESTNGTKINGEDVQLRILRYGDMIAVGRSVLLFGSRDQIAQRLAKLRDDQGDEGRTADPDKISKAANVSSLDFELNWSEAAQLAEILEFLHLRLRNLVGSVQVDGKSSRVVLDLRQWQSLLDLQARVSEYLRKIGEP
jgi:pSer/pThr/pTyr-binding forkhead associated (FHA) protein